MKYISFLRLMSGLAAVVLFQGCAATPPTPGLNETATHAGTVTMLRVDDAWAYEAKNRRMYKIGDGMDKLSARFVPVRFKEEVAGLDGSDRVVTSDDYITLTLKSGFIKYFREAGCGGAATSSPNDTPLRRSCKGEVAIVLSFDDGNAIKENLLIYSAKGQTLGSPLALDDWPVIGPVKVAGDTLRIRMVVLELDGAENEQLRQVVSFLTSVVSTVQPEAGPALRIGQSVANALIGRNVDDVIADKRFALRLAHTGAAPGASPLLFGKYILVQQEDDLVDGAIAKISPHSRNPVMISEMRYDMHSDRLYRMYPYRIESCNKASGPVDWSVFSFGNTCNPIRDKRTKEQQAALDKQKSRDAQDLEDEEKDKLVPELYGYARATSVAARTKTLGFSENLNDYTTWETQNEAFFQALYDSCRSIRATPQNDPTPENRWTNGDYTALLEKACGSENGAFRFEYPAVLYPEANVLLAQYPLHTHLIFSIDRSVERAARYDAGFANFQTFLDNEIKAVKSNNALETLAADFKKFRDGAINQDALLRQVEQMQPKNEADKPNLPFRKACELLVRGLKKADDKDRDPLMAAPVFNEIYHLVGMRFSTPDAVSGYLTAEKKCAVDRDKGACTCPPPAS